MKNILFVILITLGSFSVWGQSASDMMKAMGSGKKVKPKPEYNFVGALKFQSSAMHEGKPLKGEQWWYFPAGNENIFGVKMSMPNSPSVLSVIDYKEKAMIMFIEQQKMVMGIPLDIDKSMKDVQDDPKTKINTPKKTGRTKSILGYVCDEWVVESAENTSTMWVSQKPPFASAGFFKVMSQQLLTSTGTPLPADMKGIPLEIQAVDKKTKEKFSMVCTEISNKPSKFSTAGYKTM